MTLKNAFAFNQKQIDDFYMIKMMIFMVIIKVKFTQKNKKFFLNMKIDIFLNNTA